MSIRLKKVQWKGHGHTLKTNICGIGYAVTRVPVEGIVALTVAGKGLWKTGCDTLDAAKSACEQHALERIREAVEEFTIYEEAELERQLELCRLGRKVQELAEEARDSRESPFKYNEADKVIDAFDNALNVHEMGLDTAETVEQINALFAEIDARDERKTNGN